MEATMPEYVVGLCRVFMQVHRVLRDDGTLWLNLGDTYANKQLQMIPARVALVLQENGYLLRSDVIWHKPNAMPESASDRPTSAHEHVLLFSKSPAYYYDAEAVREDGAGSTRFGVMKFPGRLEHGGWHSDGQENTREGRNLRNVWTVATGNFSEAHFATYPPELIEPCIKAGTSEAGCCAKCGAPRVREFERQSVREYGGTRDMAKTPLNVVRAGWRKGGPETITTGWVSGCECDADTVRATVLDPFAGAGTTLLVADRLQRDAIGIEQNESYAAMAHARVTNDAPLFTRCDLIEGTQ